MGQEIDDSRFSDSDFEKFSDNLAAETQLLSQWFSEGRFSGRDRVAGSELEAWLVDGRYQAAPINEAYLQGLDNDLVVSELARFNVELNTRPFALAGDAFTRMRQGLDAVWKACFDHAGSMDASLVMIGILPTLHESELNLDNMSGMKRYQALNDQIFRRRHGRPLILDVHGKEHLHTSHYDVMAESAATSFQLHLKVALEDAVRFSNAAQLVAAPMVAVAANSPFLFGKDLWAETRIPLFEQTVVVGGFDGADAGPMRRVTFGSGYIRESVFEVFAENLEHYPVLLPMDFEDDIEKMAHLRLHNGTIWRWNRPLIGFDDDGTPHLRVEHRVLPSGPTTQDCVANAAFFYGLVFALGRREVPPEMQIQFSTARDNFYGAAKDGLDAPLTWLDNKTMPAHALIQEELLSLARRGLEMLEVASSDIDQYIGIIEARAASGQNGSTWQRAFVRKHGLNMTLLTEQYTQYQQTGRPVHEWPL